MFYVVFPWTLIWMFRVFFLRVWPKVERGLASTSSIVCLSCKPPSFPTFIWMSLSVMFYVFYRYRHWSVVRRRPANYDCVECYQGKQDNIYIWGWWIKVGLHMFRFYYNESRIRRYETPLYYVIMIFYSFSLNSQDERSCLIIWR